MIACPDRRRRWVIRHLATEQTRRAEESVSDSTPHVRLAGQSRNLEHEFAEACRAPAGALLVAKSRKLGLKLQIALKRGSLIVGSGRGCGLTLSHGDVGERELYLQWLSGRMYLVDMAVMNEPGRWWSPEEPIRVGPFKLAWFGRPSGLRTADDTVIANEPSVRIEQYWNDYRAVWTLRRRMTLVGTASGCQMQMMHPSVNPYQASLIRVGGALWLVDLAGNGRTRVGGRAISLSQLDPGDEFEIGSTLCRVLSPWSDVQSQPSVSFPLSTQ